MIEQLLINLEKIFLASPLLGLGASFLGGVLVSFSPCVYPLIPITLGVVGATKTSSHLKGFLISLTFVLGVAFVYTALGIISSVFGILLGNLFINPITYLVLAIVFLFLGISCFDFINLKIPFSVHWAKKGTFSVFILGAISGLAIIPCSFPVLGAILSFIALKKSILYGGLALFLFSLGYGTILLILGTFTSLIKKLPKEGFWVVFAERVPGVIFIIMGIYFVLKFITLR